MQINETGRQKWEQKQSEWVKQTFNQVQAASGTRPAQPALTRYALQSWIYSEHTDQAAWKILTPNLVTKGNPKHLHLE